MPTLIARGSSRPALLWLFAAVPLLATTLPVTAQERERPSKGPALTEPPTDDPEFPLLGEFVGPLQSGENRFDALGLQVRPLGDGSFEAIAYVGGLPGQTGHQPEPIRLIGRRSGDLIVLSGQPYAIFVHHDHCVIVSPEGDRLGRLERVNRQSPTMGAAPPQDAVVIFDGTNTDQFTKAEMTSDGLLMEGGEIKPMFQDFNMHVEYQIPYMPIALDQARGNSGVYLQSRYECQILDSFAMEPLFNGHGSLYRFRKPDLNMSFPPLVWQTYDIDFTAPRWSADGSKIRDARITVWVNGVKVHDNVELPDKTGAGKPEEPVLLPTKLQDHGDPVRFRNVWVIDRGLSAGIEFPVYPSQEKSSKPKSTDNKESESEPSDEPAEDSQQPAENPDAAEDGNDD